MVTRLLMRGYHDGAAEAGCLVTGGQTIRNPWVVIGGVASAVVPESEVLLPHHAVPGDVLVLTKPLGTQVCRGRPRWGSWRVCTLKRADAWCLARGRRARWR